MLSIVIPAYNEEKRIGKTLEAYSSFFRNLVEKKEIKKFELLIVMNGCIDRTIEVVKKYKKKFVEILYLDLKESGKGLAIIEGFRDALKRSNELIGFVDADLATKPEAFYDLVKNLGTYDGIIASRGKRGAIVKTSFTRKLTNRGFNFVVRGFLFLPFKDTQCGAKLFKRKAIENVVDDLGITRWAFDIDLLYKLRREGYNVKEIPTIWEDKSGSKLNLTRVPLLMFLSIVRLRVLNSPFKSFIRFYNKLPEWIKIHHRLR